MFHRCSWPIAASTDTRSVESIFHNRVPRLLPFSRRKIFPGVAQRGNAGKDFCGEICGEAGVSTQPHRPCGGGNRAFAPARTIICRDSRSRQFLGQRPVNRRRRGGGVGLCEIIHGVAHRGGRATRFASEHISVANKIAAERSAAPMGLDDRFINFSRGGNHPCLYSAAATRLKEIGQQMQNPPAAARHTHTHIFSGDTTLRHLYANSRTLTGFRSHQRAQGDRRRPPCGTELF